MRLRSILLKFHNQRGVLLPELLVVIAVSGAICSVMAMTIINTNNAFVRNRNHIMSIAQVHNAGYWIQVDARRAQEVTVDAGDSGLPVNLDWTTWDSTSHRVTYAAEDNQLKRTYTVGGTELSTITIAHSIVTGSPATTCRFVDRDNDGTGDVLVFNVTASKGSGSHRSSESREFRFEPRSG